VYKLISCSFDKVSDSFTGKKSLSPRDSSLRDLISFFCLLEPSFDPVDKFRSSASSDFRA
jgi:hypothetical protein